MTDRAPTHSPAWRRLTERQKGALLVFAERGGTGNAADLTHIVEPAPEHRASIAAVLREVDRVLDLAARSVLRRFEADVAREHEAHHAQLAVDALAAVLRLADDYRANCPGSAPALRAHYGPLARRSQVRVVVLDEQLGERPPLDGREGDRQGALDPPDGAIVVGGRISRSGTSTEATATVPASAVVEALLRRDEVVVRLLASPGPDPDHFADFRVQRDGSVVPLASPVDYALHRLRESGDLDLAAGWEDPPARAGAPDGPTPAVVVPADRYYPHAADVVRGHGRLDLARHPVAPGAVVRFRPLHSAPGLFADFRLHLSYAAEHRRTGPADRLAPTLVALSGLAEDDVEAAVAGSSIHFTARWSPAALRGATDWAHRTIAP